AALARRDCEASHLSYYHDLARVARADAPQGPPAGSPLAGRIERFASMTFETAAASDTAVGAPETVLRRLTDLHARYRCGHIMGWFSFGGRIPHDRVLASMRLFAEEVAPRLP
ncbi:MAG: hypothetical protein OXI03_11060, partial [Chloroflexota bacterium]|nr:hypothetical protein [Chloroflexota bacterium]